ncbi:MAG: FtsW/RodA/SpoVE family cell cycle protein [Acidimicrobiia bacterium]|nr:FtsW/RodA/SpoVE family cell cycle protein [Acidimicrobiia bacterium]NNL69891.1 FtsW/RodA/SpoVE family cell cycle protein [Acidimicrobiia bacterium]
MSRNAEAALLVGAAILAALGTAIVTAAGGDRPDAQTALTFIIMLAAFGSLHLAFRQWAAEASPYLLPIAALLTAVGLVEIFRLDARAASLQRWWLLIAAGLGIAVLFLLKRLGIEALLRYRYLFLAGALILFLLPLLPSSWPLGGVEVNGSRLWLQLRVFDTTVVRFQPAELAKVLLVIFLASYLASRHRALSTMTRRLGPLSMPEPRQLFPLAAAWALSLVVLVYQRDLGASLLLLALFASMLYAASGRLSYPLVGAGLFVAGAVIAAQVFDHVQRRFDAWIRPWDDFADSGFQIAQSLFALGSGSLTGSGLGLGRPDFIPSATTDFVFSAVAEETGLAGSLAVVAAYALLVAVGFGIALRARDPYRKLLAAGLTAAIAIQAILIIGGVTRLLPLTGITLPFMSYGGSSLVANVIAIVILARLSHEIGNSASPSSLAVASQLRGKGNAK